MCPPPAQRILRDGVAIQYSLPSPDGRGELSHKGRSVPETTCNASFLVPSFPDLTPHDAGHGLPSGRRPRAFLVHPILSESRCLSLKEVVFWSWVQIEPDTKEI